jgi:AI-2 transport protein TqsA
VAFALFIIAIVWPLQSMLQSRLPKLLALAGSILATIVIVAAIASMIVWGFGRVGRYIANDAPRFQLLYDQSTGCPSLATDHGQDQTL